MSEFDGLWKHGNKQRALVPPKTECDCLSGGRIKYGHTLTPPMEERRRRKNPHHIIFIKKDQTLCCIHRFLKSLRYSEPYIFSVCVNGGEFFQCLQGLKPGCIVSPILFSLLINELANEIITNGKHGVYLGAAEIELVFSAVCWRPDSTCVCYSRVSKPATFSPCRSREIMLCKYRQIESGSLPKRRLLSSQRKVCLRRNPVRSSKLVQIFGTFLFNKTQLCFCNGGLSY